MTDGEVRSFERENIIRSLEACNWKVGGERGAAEMFGIKPTTLLQELKL